MTGNVKTLLELPPNNKAVIKNIRGGIGFRRRLQVIGLREGQTISIISKQPFRGPLTISTKGCQMTLGRGMANKILVEEI